MSEGEFIQSILPGFGTTPEVKKEDESRELSAEETKLLESDVLASIRDRCDAGRKPRRATFEEVKKEIAALGTQIPSYSAIKKYLDDTYSPLYMRSGEEWVIIYDLSRKKSDPRPTVSTSPTPPQSTSWMNDWEQAQSDREDERINPHKEEDPEG
ncbi:MAG: hypothetical protein WC243_01675 [Patescibacteria group bacterium]|jgi:hypothetical protein